MEELFGNTENARKFNASINIMATRIATVFASLKVYNLLGFLFGIIFLSIKWFFLPFSLWKCLNKFALPQELPYVRYHAAQSDDSTEASPRDLIPTKLAAAVWDIISNYKSSIPNFPQKETCELLILDRSVDQVTIPCPVPSVFSSMFCMLLYFDLSNVVIDCSGHT